MSSSNTNKSPSTTTPPAETPPSTVPSQPSIPHFPRPRSLICCPEGFVKPALVVLAPPMPPPRTPEPEPPEPTDHEFSLICSTGATNPKAPVHHGAHLPNSSVSQNDSRSIRSTGVPVKIQSGIPGPTPVPLNFAVMGKPVVQRAAPAMEKE